MLSFLIYGSQIVGVELIKPKFFEATIVEPDLLEAALEEMEEDESEKKIKRKLAKKDKHRTQQTESSNPSSSSEQNFDFGDVVVTISEREMEDIPSIYLEDTDSQASSLTVKKPSKRQTSSIRSQEKSKREPSSK